MSAKPYPPTATRDRGRTDWSGVAFGTLIAVLAAHAQFKLPPLLPVLTEAYGYPNLMAGAMMSIYAAVGLVLSIPVGRWTQRVGGAPVFAVAIGSIVAGTILMMMFPTQVWLVLFARGVEGVGFTILAILGPVITARSANDQHRPLTTGLTATWIPLGQLTGIVAAQPALAIGSWQLAWIFGLAVALAIGAWGVVASGRGQLPAGSPRRRSGGRTEGLGTTGQRRLLMLAAAVFGLYSLQFMAFMTWLPTYLVAVQDMGVSEAIWAASVPVVTLLVFNLTGGMLLRMGVGLAVVLTGALCLQVVVWLVVPFAPHGLWGLAILILYGAGSGTAPTCLFALPSVVLGRAAGPRAFGIILTGRNLGVLIGPVLLGGMAAGATGWQSAAWLFAGLTLLALMLAVGIGVYRARLVHNGDTD